MEYSKKIVNTGELLERKKPGEGVLVSGTFDFDTNYTEQFLSWAASRGRPLMVIVQGDEMIKLRRGGKSPLHAQKDRAKSVASLEEVDYVLCLDKTAHDTELVKEIDPYGIVLQGDNREYREQLAHFLKQKFPNLWVWIADFHKEKKLVPATRGSVTEQVLAKLPKNNIDIQRYLESLAATGMSETSNISALLVDKKHRSFLESVNDISGAHAECLLLEGVPSASFDLKSSTLYVLIPPCLMCAMLIYNAGIKRVFYAHEYGDGKGLHFLIDKGVKTGALYDS